MVNQKAISVKLDLDVFDILEEEVSVGNMKRNAIINDAVRLYADFADALRKIRCRHSMPSIYSPEVKDLLDDWRDCCGTKKWK